MHPSHMFIIVNMLIRVYAEDVRHDNSRSLCPLWTAIAESPQQEGNGADRLVRGLWTHAQLHFADRKRQARGLPENHREIGDWVGHETLGTAEGSIVKANRDMA